MRCLVVYMKDIIALRRVLHPSNASAERVAEIRSIVGRIEDAPAPLDSRLRALFSQEVTVARTMVRLIEVQDDFRRDMRKAIENCDVVELNRLLVRAERLEMGRDPVVEAGRLELTQLHRRRTVMKGMVAFLRNENEYGADPADLLREAASLGVDEAFISKVRRVFEGAGPRLKARARLRAAVETVNRRDAEAGLEEIATLQVRPMLHSPAFSPLSPFPPLTPPADCLSLSALPRHATRASQTPSAGRARCCCGCCPSRSSCAPATTCRPFAGPRTAPARARRRRRRAATTTAATGRASHPRCCSCATTSAARRAWKRRERPSADCCSCAVAAPGWRRRCAATSGPAC